MPNRIIRDGINRSEKVDSLSEGAENFYRRLLNEVDDFGRLDARPSVLKAACYTLRVDKMTDDEILVRLNATVEAGLVIVYEVGGKKYLQVLNLGEPRAKRSRYPAPPPESCAHVRADVPPYALRLSNSPTPFGKECSEAASGGSQPPADEEPAFPVFPTVAGRTTSDRTWTLTPDLAAQLEAAYPGVNVMNEARRSHVWIITHPGNRKTASGMPAFMNRWMERAQNFAPRNGVGNGYANSRANQRAFHAGLEYQDDLPVQARRLGNGNAAGKAS